MIDIDLLDRIPALDELHAQVTRKEGEARQIGRSAAVMGMVLAVPAAAVLKVVVVETTVTLRRFRL